MSEPKLISPLLDGFLMGDPISDHHGVRCCPAMRAETGEKYIVKILSVPASQTQLEALLLAGAFQDRDSAAEYFKELSQGIVEEAVLLQRLSRLEGFLPYENWQVVPMEEGTGFDVYLLAPYRPTLDRLLRKNTMTHLGAVNLGLDLCAAMAVSRRSGYLYADLRPSNIYLTDDKEYRIGDLGFVSLGSLAFASLPERCHSVYTAPEITDAYSALNDTLDIYAAGLILYQAYNEGQLPESGAPLAAPKYADPEMAQIILKGCAADPQERWQDPGQMGQALVTYLQANRINDDPIVPVVEEAPAPVVEPAAEEEDVPATETILAEVDEALEGAVPVCYDIPAEETPVEEARVEEAPVEEAPVEEAPVEEAPVEEAPVEEAPVEEAPVEETPVEETPVEETPVEEAPEAEEGSEAWEEALVAQQIDQMMEQADELIAHTLPEPPVVPDPIEIPIPAPIVEPEEEAAAHEEVPEEEEAAAPEQLAEEEAEEYAESDYDEEEEEVPAKKSRKGLRIAIIAIVIALIAALAAGAYYYYNNIYLQTVLGLHLSGEEDRLTVTLNTQVDNTLLTVYCTDTYGNTLKQSVENNVAQFSGLNADTRYKVHVQISGLHKLIGITSDTYTTAELTTVSNFTAITGAEDGSVILTFAVEGPDAHSWNIYYGCNGNEELTPSFIGTTYTITGLTPGEEYTFRLEPSEPLYISGETTLTYTASNLVYPEDLAITGFLGDTLTAQWKMPEGVNVPYWIVRCYNDAGFDKTIQVEECAAVFAGLDPTTAYTVEVKAAGMSVAERTYVTANPVTITNATATHEHVNRLKVTWEFEGTAPEGGWLVLYTATGYAEQQVVRSDSTEVTISPVIPGAQYEISIQPATGSTVFGGTLSFTAPEAESFAGYWLTAECFDFRMCPTPANPNWGRLDVTYDQYTTVYAPGASASYAIYITGLYITSEDEITTLVVFRDADGHIVKTMSSARVWTSMWYQGFGKLDLPVLPATEGEYTAEIYFNGDLVGTKAFTIQQPIAPTE